jgi:hypothetical protein
MLPMPGTLRSCALTVVLCFLLPNAIQGQTPLPDSSASNISDQLSPKLVEMINTQVAWDTGFKNPSGPRLRFVQFEEFTHPDGHFIRYRIYSDGIRAGTPYILALLKIGVFPEDVQILSSSVFVNSKGLLLTTKPTRDEEDSETAPEGVEYDVGIRAANGEPLRFLLRSKDNKVFIPGTLVPYPIASTNNGCKLEARLADAEGRAILIYGDGFSPNSEVPVQSDSSGEIKVSKQSVDTNGHVQFIELPFVSGKDSGILKDSISAKDCTVLVSIPWGKGTYQKR